MKEDLCFAYRKNQCEILNVIACNGCSFYKTMDQLIKERQKCLDRILTLDENLRGDIMEKYYGEDSLF